MLNAISNMSKAIVVLGFVFFIFVSMPGQASMEQASSEVSFQDEQLEQAVKQLLHKDANESVSQKDMEALTVVDLSNKGIKSVQGLQNASNITHLNLSRNEIEDISPLQSLTALRALDLSNNRVTSIDDLSAMKDMGRLKLNGNSITSIEVVKQFSRLHTFEANDNQISSIQPLSTSTDVTWLQLSNNQITDIKPLSKLIKLKNLNLSNNKIKDLSPLKPLSKSLMNLQIASNQITDIRVLEEMTLLSSLYAGNNQIKKIDALSKLTNLGILDLSSNFIYDLEPLRSLDHISVLYLSDNRIWNIEPLHNHRFDTHYDTGALRYGLTLSYNYLDLRSKSKTYRLLNDLSGEGSTYNQFKAQRLIIGSRTAYVGEASFALSVAPFIEKGRTYVPIRFISERLGANVSWNQSKKEVTIRKDNKTIQWKVNEKKAKLNGQAVSFDTPLLLKKNTTFVPMRFVSELLDSSVEYVAKPKKTVIIFENK